MVPKVTCDPPLQRANGVRDLPHIKNLSLADPHFDQLGWVDLLIGCNLLQDILRVETQQGEAYQHIRSSEDNIWMGHHVSLFYGTKGTIVCHQQVYAMWLTSDELVIRFWKTEEISASSPCYTPEEEDVMKHFNSNSTFLTIGRYQVNFPRNQIRCSYACRIETASSKMLLYQ